MVFMKLLVIKGILVFGLIFSMADLRAQVPVHMEPFHRLVFENGEVRIMNVVIPPGDTSLYHLHATPSVFIFLSSTAAGTQLQGKRPVSMQFITGRVLFEDLGTPNTRIHRAWNEDREDLHVLDVELLAKDTGFKTPPLAQFKMEVDTPWVRAYRVVLEKDKELVLKTKKNPFILVSIDAAPVEVKQAGKYQSEILKKGSYFDVKRKQSFTLKNTSTDPVQLVLLELP
jgi:hypothetical protein